MGREDKKRNLIFLLTFNRILVNMVKENVKKIKQQPPGLRRVPVTEICTYFLSAYFVLTL